ncbi:MAG: sensor histidine kinase [Acidobacteria bacterium]|nr:sensor histidine kinase [Acidobacteriota bacterium]
MSEPINQNTPANKLHFQVKPRLLAVLGEQLIRDASLAVFELVKNAYDADATNCRVLLEHIESKESGLITVEDDGCGMNENVLRNAWMTIATDFRADQKLHKKRTLVFNRFPLGEKGLGRLSIHKLGRFIRLITRVQGGKELVVEFNWDTLETSDNLNAKDAGVILQEREPKTFPGKKHGTRLEVSRLRDTWTRGELRRLHRGVNSLCSPFKGPEDFKVTLSAPNNEDWLEGLLTPEDVYRCALYNVTGYFEGEAGYFDYRFTPPLGTEKQLTSRNEKVAGFKLERKEGRKSYPLDLSKHKIGRVEFEFWLFDRDSGVLKAVTDDVNGLKDYLNENGGIRVYRDGIRVYDFGEPGNDWLNLDLRRVNTPTARTSNNQILGVLRLDAMASGDLREKSNREGFIENNQFEDFRSAVVSVLTQVEAEKIKDQKRVREVLGKGTGQKVFLKLSELRDTLASKGMLAEVEPRLKEVEKELEIYRDQLLHAAVPGLNLGIMLHGAEKTLEELRQAVKKDPDISRIRELVDRLYRAMRPVTNLLKNPGVQKTSASVLVKEAIFSTELRLKRHGIRLVNGMELGCPDFKAEGSKQMLIASIVNLIDNSIHWLEIKNPTQKLIYLTTTNDLDGGPAIVVADNGPGLGNDDPEDLIAPFFSRRNGGMGLGLYIVNEVMRVNQGRLVFPNPGDIDLPAGIDGAVVALQFLEV